MTELATRFDAPVLGGFSRQRAVSSTCFVRRDTLSSARREVRGVFWVKNERRVSRRGQLSLRAFEQIGTFFEKELDEALAEGKSTVSEIGFSRSARDLLTDKITKRFEREGADALSALKYYIQTPARVCEYSFEPRWTLSSITTVSSRRNNS